LTKENEQFFLQFAYFGKIICEKKFSKFVTKYKNIQKYDIQIKFQ